MEHVLMPIHIVTGSLSLLSGFTSIFSKKGSKIHRKSGNIFFVSMVIMCLSGTSFALMKPDMATTISGMVVLYMLITSQITIREKPGETGWYDRAAFALGIIIVTVGIFSAFRANQNQADGYQIYGTLTFVSIAIIGLLFDLRVLYKGIRGKQRIIRHIGRVCYSFLITVISLFIGQEQIFPEFIRSTSLLFLPVIIVFAFMLYWLIKTWTKPLSILKQS